MQSPPIIFNLICSTRADLHDAVHWLTHQPRADSAE